MNPKFFDELESEMVFENPSAPAAQPRASVPGEAQRPPQGDRPRRRGNFPKSQKNQARQAGKQSLDPRKRPPQRQKGRPVPKNVAVARSVAADSGVLVLVFLAESTRRALVQPPRIESRGFFLPHEIREGHKFLVSESRRSYEETLKDVPDIETRDLEKIVKKDLEKAVGERFNRMPLVISTILVA